MFAQQPAGFERSWRQGLAISFTVLGVLLLIGYSIGAYGYAFVIGAPFVAGMFIGRWANVPTVLKYTTGAVLLGSVIFAAVITNLAGFICGFIMGMIAAGPLLAGVAVGSILFGESRPSSSVFSVAIVALLIPLEQAALPTPPIESVSTSHIVSMAPDEAFRRIEFYEDTRGTPPTLLKIALPRPIRTRGGPDRVGAVRRCLYDSGYIVKKITELDPPHQYAFEVIKQRGVEDHSVELIDGSFEFAPVGSGRTKVTLTTRYRPKLSARLAWRPFEQAVLHSLHHHVISAIESDD